MLSDRVKKLQMSQTVMIAGEAIKLKSEGVDLIDLSVGEPDYNTPEFIKEAGISAIDKNYTKYTINQGLKELREAIASKLKKDNQLDYSINQIIVSTGGKQSIYNAIFALVNPGDEVIIPSPYWGSYTSIVQLAGGNAIILETDEKNGFKISPEQLESAITNKTKLLILCNPSNPTGAVYFKQELEGIAEVIVKYKLFVLSDEIYEKLIYDNNKFTSIASLDNEIKKRTILVNGVSKSFAMTGWRIGYAAAEENIISAMNKLQSHTTSSASSISQWAALKALEGPQDVINKMVSEFSERRNFLFNAITSIDGIECYRSEGAFYLFPNVSKFFNSSSKNLKITNSFDLAMYLLHEVHLAVIPGSGFGKDGYIRLSYSNSIKNLKEGALRLGTALDAIRK